MSGDRNNFPRVKHPVRTQQSETVATSCKAPFPIQLLASFHHKWFTFGLQALESGCIIESMRAHQHFRHRLDIVLVEKPDFESLDLLRVADANRLRNADAAFSQEFARRRIDAE